MTARRLGLYVRAFMAEPTAWHSCFLAKYLSREYEVDLVFAEHGAE